MKRQLAAALAVSAVLLAAGCSGYRPAPPAFHEAINKPYVGSIPARGYTAQQMEGQIATRLRNGFLRSPDVSVEVDRYRPIFIMGEVGAAGQYSYVPGMTVQKAVAAAGGYTPRANQENVDITRAINNEVMTGRVRTSEPILPGDTIYVRERLF